MNQFLRTITKLFVIITFLVLSVYDLQAQCSCPFSNNIYPLQPLTPTSSWQQLQNQWAGEASEYLVQSGNTYQWSYCSADGGAASVDLRLNLFNGSSYITCNSDFCGQDPKITWTATFTGTVRVQTNQYLSSSNPCSINNTPGTLSYRMSSGTPGNYADLVPQNFTATPSPIQAGEDIDLDVEIYNQGTASAPSGTTLTYWLSQDAVYTSGVDIWLYDESVSSVSVGGTRTESQTVEIPSSTAPGNWNILFAVDALGEVNESNEANNVGVRAIVVTGVPQIGSIQVTINPSGANSDGAQWNLDNGTWQDNGDILSNIPVGAHTVYYKNIGGWNTPSSQIANILANTCIYKTGNYTEVGQSGPIKVTINPQAAIASGAKWRIDGGSWEESGDVVYASIGSHTIDYLAVSGWNEPGAQVVSVNTVQTNLSAIYTVVGGGCFNDTYPFGNDIPNSEDPWNFEKKECTSYTAWKINESAGYTDLSLEILDYPLNNYMFGTVAPGTNCIYDANANNPFTKLSNACFWDDVFLINGYTVNTTPAVGAIAHFGFGEAGESSQGHVAFVEEVNGNMICISDYNGYGNQTYLSRQIDISIPNTGGNRTPSKYIHFADGTGGGGTGIINYTINDEILIYPNPSSGNIKVLFDQNDIVNKINIYNAFGQLVYHVNINSALLEKEFDLSHLANGYYTFEIIKAVGRQYGRFAITK